MEKLLESDERQVDERQVNERQVDERQSQERMEHAPEPPDPAQEGEDHSRRKRVRVRYGRREYLLAAVLLAASWFYMRGVRFFPMQGVWLPVFSMLFLLAGVLYLTLPAEHEEGGKTEERGAGRMTGEAKFYLLLIAAAAGWFLMKYLPGNECWEDQDIMLCVGLFLHSMGVYWVLTIAENRVGGCLDERAPWDLARGFGLPFLYLGSLFGLAGDAVRGIRRGLAGKIGTGGEKGKSAEVRDLLRSKGGEIGLGLLISAPVLLIVLPMLAEADESFRRFADRFTGWNGSLLQFVLDLFSFSEIWWNLLLLFIACYLFGLFYGAFHANVPKKPKKFLMPATVLLTFSAVICGVYLLFFLVKFTDAAGIMSEEQRDLVYSSYARQGFFELCFIAVINFCLFYFVRCFSELSDSWIRRALTGLGIETLGFIALAFSKMSLYISVYGFTFKRVFTSWFMCVLFVTFVLLVRAVWRRFNAIRLSVWFASVTFLLLAYSNMEVWMERLNRIFPFAG